MFLNNAIDVMEQNLNKTIGKSMFFNNSIGATKIGATQHFCHAPPRPDASQILSQAPFQKHNDFFHSPNSCLQHGVLAMNLVNCLVSPDFASRVRPQLLSHVCCDFNILESSILRILLWQPGKSTLQSASCSSFIKRVSKCCCSPRHTQNVKVRHLSSTIIIIKILQKRQ